jgi:hypothetical protein
MYLFGFKPSSFNLLISLWKTTSGSRVESIQLAYWISQKQKYLDSNHKVSTVLQEEFTVKPDDSGLVWLRNVSEYHIAHFHEESILPWSSGIVYQWHNICSFFSHIYQVPTASSGKFNSIQNSGL